MSWGAGPGSIAREGARLRVAVFAVAVIGVLATAVLYMRSQAPDLEEIPVDVGWMVFNATWEPVAYPSWTSTEPDPAWTTSDFTITTDRTFSGTFILEDRSTPPQQPLVADFLFVEVAGTYLEDEGDFSGLGLSRVMPFQCETEERSNAVCRVEGTFLPPIRTNFFGRVRGPSLRRVSVHLTWVRVYHGESEHVLQVFAGAGGASAEFDRSPAWLAARFRYYPAAPVSELQIAHPSFDVKQWLEDRLPR